MSVVTENNKNHLLDYEGVESLLVKINDRFARTDRYATRDKLGMIKAEINTDVNSENINAPDTTGDNYPVQVTTNGVAFVNIPNTSEDNPDSTYLKLDGTNSMSGELRTLDISPISNETYKLGNFENKWNSVHTKYLYLGGTESAKAGSLFSDNNYIHISQNGITPIVIDSTDTESPYVRTHSTLAGKTKLGAYNVPWAMTYSLGYKIPDCTNEDVLFGDGTYKNKKQLIPNLIGNGALTNALERDLSKFPATSTLFTCGWASTGTNFATNYGTTLDVSYSTWYQRLAFNTAGRIEYFRGINTNNSDNTVATLYKIGDLAYTSDIPTTLKNPYSLTIQGNGTTLTNGIYDGSSTKTINITPASIGAASIADVEGSLYKTIYAGGKETTEQGILVKTSVNETSNAMISVKITGNAYCAGGGTKPILTILEFYNYYNGGNSNPRIINISGTHFGADLGVIKIFNYDNKVCLWIPQTGNYQSFNVFANWTNSSGVDNNVNIVESLTKGEMPTDGVTYLVEFTPKQVSYNDEIVTTEGNGLVPKADSAANTLSSQANDWVLAKKGDSIDWCKLPSEAFSNNNYYTPCYLGICNTAANILDKAVNRDNLLYSLGTLSVGSSIYVKFVNGHQTLNTDSEPLMLTISNIQFLVKYKGAAINSSNPISIPQNGIVHFIVTDSNVVDVVGMYEASSTGGLSEYLPLAGGTLTGNLYTSHIIPSDAGTPNIGTDSTRFGSGYFNNKVYAVNGFYEQSDENLKDFSTDIYCDLDKLSKLPKMYYRWKDDKNGVLHIGTSAQEVQKIYPELVTELEDGTLSVAYDKLSIVALKGIDILNDKIKSLEDRLERIEKLINI